MTNYLIDYYFLDENGNRENDYYETVELEAESDDDATIKSVVKAYLSENAIGYCDIEIASTFIEENSYKTLQEFAASVLRGELTSE